MFAKFLQTFVPNSHKSFFKCTMLDKKHSFFSTFLQIFLSEVIKPIIIFSTSWQFRNDLLDKKINKVYKTWIIMFVFDTIVYVEKCIRKLLLSKVCENDDTSVYNYVITEIKICAIIYFQY